MQAKIFVSTLRRDYGGVLDRRSARRRHFPMWTAMVRVRAPDRQCRRFSGCTYRDTPKREGRGPFCTVESCPVEKDEAEVETEGASSEGRSSSLEGIPKSYRWIMATFLLTSLGVAVIAALRKVATNVYYKERVVRHYSSVEMHAREDNISETDSAWSQTFGSRQVS